MGTHRVPGAGKKCGSLLLAAAWFSTQAGQYNMTSDVPLRPCLTQDSKSRERAFNWPHLVTCQHLAALVPRKEGWDPLALSM